MKILVGLSGGVDSAVAAYILKKQGHNVTCAFMRNWDSLANNDILGNPTLDNEICSQETDYNDAKLVADALGLELLRIDFIKEYWDFVFTYFSSPFYCLYHYTFVFYFYLFSFSLSFSCLALTDKERPFST